MIMFEKRGRGLGRNNEGEKGVTLYVNVCYNVSLVHRVCSVCNVLGISVSGL